jgi:syntaxin 16
MNELVIEQGSLIDRIDFNIEETVGHVERGVEHLRKAEEHAECTCASKCMLVLVGLIFLLVIAFGLTHKK